MQNESLLDNPQPEKTTSLKLMLKSAIFVMIGQGLFLYWWNSQRGITPGMPPKVAAELVGSMFFALLIAAYFSAKKNWSYTTAIVFLFLLSTLIFVGMRLKKSAENTKVVEQQMQSLFAFFDQYVKTLESVKDDASAKNAHSRLLGLYQQAFQIAVDIKKGPSISQVESESLMKNYEPRLLQLKDRCEQAIINMEELKIDTRPFEEETRKLQTLFKWVNE